MKIEKAEWSLSANYKEISIKIQTPFISRMVNMDPLSRFADLSLELFDGSTDPREHILQYHNSKVPLRILEEIREAKMCKMFGNNLKEPMLMWYYSLKLVSVDSFRYLSKKFRWQFSPCMKARKELNYLFYVLQHKEEALRLLFLVILVKRCWRYLTITTSSRYKCSGKVWFTNIPSTTL